MVFAPFDRLAAPWRRLLRRPRSAPRAIGRIRLAVNALHAKSGGGVTYLRNLLPLLADDPRFEVHVVLHRDQLPLFQPLDQRLAIHPLDLRPGLARLMIWEQLSLPGMMRAMAADVVFSPANFGSLPIRDQVIVLRNALAVARTETRLSKRIYWAALGVLTFLSLVRCRRAIAVSGYAARSLSLGRPSWFAGKVRVVHHGVDAFFQPAAQPRRGGFVLAVSDIYVQKNLHTLFRAMRLVCDRHPGMVLRVAGQSIDAWYYDRAVELAAELGITANVEFLGRLPAEDLRPLYQHCAAFVFPSTAETFGNPLVEAMACGAPVVSSDATAMPEIVGDAALLVDPFDVAAMAAAILRVVDDAALAETLSRRALRRAADFSWRRTAAETGDVLAEAAKKAP